jgi:hypothetical protein
MCLETARHFFICSQLQRWRTCEEHLRLHLTNKMKWESVLVENIQVII